MPESPQEWFTRVSELIERDGHRTTNWHEWSTWPFDDTPNVRDLEPPAPAEPHRGGAGGVDCHACRVASDPERAEEVVWHDDIAMLTAPQATSLPVAAFLGPRRHADLADLTDHEAAHLGVLLTRLERAASAILDVPRLQVLRWGDGGEHLHWWLLARPTGVLQLRGTFLSLWDDILPARDRADVLADLRLIAEQM